MIQAAAYLFALLAAVVAVFQLGLAAGAPWGHLTQGGAHAGRLPAGPRATAGASAVLLAGMAVLVLARAGVLGAGAAHAVGPWAWAAVAVSLATTLANAATPSAKERRTWLPVAIGMAASSLAVVLGAT